MESNVSKKLDETKENALNSNLNSISADNSAVEQSFSKSSSKCGETVPYILNGELYEIIERQGENVTVKCRSCPSGRFYRGSVRSTGNFHMHIKRRHSCLLGKLHEMKVHSLLERRDRLLKNRKAKLRRILVNNVSNSSRDEHELHKLKIRRAFQRHQAEAKGYVQIPQIEPIPTAPEIKPVIKEPTTEEFIDCNCINISSVQHKEAIPNDVQLPVPTTSDIVPSENVLVNLHMYTVEPVSKVDNSVPCRHTTPTPNNSTNDGSTFDDLNAVSYSLAQNKCNEIIEQSPLDLSLTTRSRSPSPAHFSNTSSGIGLENMWSNTTVANTVSSIIPSVAAFNHTSSSECNEVSVSWWQQRLAHILCDIHNDIRARNRIEHNRLLLEIAKLRFLHPDFCFNLQN